MPDAIQLLEHDHREVERLIARYEQSGDADVVARICDELTVHMEVEEQAFYPTVATKVTGARELVREGKREHREVKDAIAEIRRRGPDGDVRELLTTVKRGVEHHVHEEEHELFPKVRAEMAAELGRLGERIERTKQDLQSRGAADGLEEQTKDELYAMAREQGIEGRSAMRKDELVAALRDTR